MPQRAYKEYISSGVVSPREDEKIEPEGRKQDGTHHARPVIAYRVQPDGYERGDAGDPEEPKQTAGEDAFQEGRGSWRALFESCGSVRKIGSMQSNPQHWVECFLAGKDLAKPDAPVKFQSCDWW